MSIRTTIATLVSLILMAVAASADSIPSRFDWTELVDALRQARPPSEASPAGAWWRERDLDRRLRRLVDLLLTYPTQESARESHRERGGKDDDSRNRDRRRRRHQTPRASGPQAVPEPGGLVLITVGAVVACTVLRRRAERRDVPR